MGESFVAVLMGSDSDLPRMEETFGVLRALEIPFEARILSAHRTPDATHEYVRDADRRGCAVFIAAAGMAAHLAGTVAGL
ncbi:MAG TPA: AIR carboxylase family protein, partial [Chromatiales bacterium]|nr:AIR carboxylase family protein [Chromatiales bacterium]